MAGESAAIVLPEPDVVVSTGIHIHCELRKASSICRRHAPFLPVPLYTGAKHGAPSPALPSVPVTVLSVSVTADIESRHATAICPASGETLHGSHIFVSVVVAAES